MDIFSFVLFGYLIFYNKCFLSFIRIFVSTILMAAYDFISCKNNNLPIH